MGEKSQFVLGMKDYLSGILGTSHGKIVEDAANREPIGVCFRKNMCSYELFERLTLLRIVTDFATSRKMKTSLDSDYLELQIDQQGYKVSVEVGEAKDGDICIGLVRK
jgi:hypothetical protein